MSFRGSSVDTRKEERKYVYDLPYHERHLLCLCLDLNDKWKELGGKLMGFDYYAMTRFQVTAMQGRSSPTSIMLDEWGSQNHTILNLFSLLHKMRHYQAMKILKPFVDVEYHKHIRDDDQMPSFSSTTSFNTHSPRSDSSASSRSRPPARQNTPDGPGAASESSSKQSASGSDNTPATLETELSRMTFDACSLHISYKELELATNHWDRKLTLGRGGFGVVFKGSWKNTYVAIKRLEPQRPNDPHYKLAEIQRQQSLRELKYLNNYKHDNILPLYGYSIDGEKPCLIYQYMSNGSLEDRLQRKQLQNKSTAPLTWLQRVNIAAGAAKGLQFLHGMDTPLIHGDIKSANILLDQNFVAKIGDFGLAKEGPVRDITHVEISKVQGTRPYLPHEFLRGRKLSVKVDTYGFGVVLFELATGLRAYDESRKEKFLRELCQESDNIGLLKDKMAGTCDDNFFIHLMNLGKKCTHNTAKNRPFMVEVFRELENMLLTRETIISNKSIYPTSMDRRPSLQHPSTGVLIPPFLYPSPPVSKQPGLSTSPSPGSYLPQVMEITQESRCCFGEPTRVQALPPQRSVAIPTNEPPVVTVPQRNPDALVPPQINVQSSTPPILSNDVGVSDETSFEDSNVSVGDVSQCVSVAEPKDKVEDDVQDAPVPLLKELGNV